MDIDQLNQTYGLGTELTFQSGPGDLPQIVINNASATATLSLYSGHLLVFKPHHQVEDLIFVSDRALYQPGKAIRGGCPICWPWFGPDPTQSGRPNHGFVRNRLWTVRATETTPTGETRVQLALNDTPETCAIWPYAFQLILEVIVGETLTLNLITANTGTEAFPLTQALHTYFNIGDINQVQVKGLRDLTYIDKVSGGDQKQQNGEVTIGEEVDRIYLGVPSELRIDDPVFNRQIVIQSTGNQTAIVWNPWIAGAAKMADLGDQDYQRFVCVETANAATDAVELQPGKQFQLSATYQVAPRV